MTMVLLPTGFMAGGLLAYTVLRWSGDDIRLKGEVERQAKMLRMAWVFDRDDETTTYEEWLAELAHLAEREDA